MQPKKGSNRNVCDVMGAGLVILAVAVSGCASGPTVRRTAAADEVQASSQRDESVLSVEDMEEIDRIVRTGLSSINRCYQEEMNQAASKYEKDVLLKIKVGVSQRATEMSVDQRSHRNAEFERCAIETMRGWEFPKIPEETWFTFPILLKPAF